MATPQTVWGHLQELMNAPAPFYMEAFQQVIQAVEMIGLRLGLLLHTYQIEPESINGKRLQRTIPYYSEKPFDEGFQKLAENGFLVTVGEAYRLSEKGRRTLSIIFNTVCHPLAEIEADLPSDELKTLLDLTHRLDQAIQSDTYVSEKLVYTMQQRVVPTEVHSILSDISDYGSNLVGYRCDIHRHAWQQYGCSGPAWEALSTIWLGKANSPETLEEVLINARPTRGYYATNYVSYLNELAELGWVEVANGTYQLTPEGQQVRQTVEALTDHHFYALWNVLNATELDQLDQTTQSIARHLALRSSR